MDRYCHPAGEPDAEQGDDIVRLIRNVHMDRLVRSETGIYEQRRHDARTLAHVSVRKLNRSAEQSHG